jgi:ring-1,2-phenylacetyl-CoA epoxidase subunit PaaC
MEGIQAEGIALRRHRQGFGEGWMTMQTTLDNAEQAQQNAAYKAALVDFLYQLADDDLVLGHRDSEWLGLAPEIEEDVAFSSISQDEVGHATFYYGLLEALGEGTADELAFHRAAAQRRNSLLTERENGDWAHTIVRHYFYDVFEDIRLQALENSSYLPLRRGAAKIRREEFYHLLHLEMWFRHLALAGGEALERMQHAVDVLWADLDNLFDTGSLAHSFVDFGIVAMDKDDFRLSFMSRVKPVMSSVRILEPDVIVRHRGRDYHTEVLADLLVTLGEVRNLDAEAIW